MGWISCCAGASGRGFLFTPQLFARPQWLARFLLDGGLPAMPNIVVPGKGPLRVGDAHTALTRGAFFWEDMKWIRDLSKGSIVINGVVTVQDARRSLDHGAAAIVVSNHSGRQLDGVPATMRVLPEIVAAVEGRSEVLVDSGIRRGTDVVKSVVLGGPVRFSAGVCVWLGCCRRGGRHSRPGNPARRSRSNAEAAGLSLSSRSEPFVGERCRR